MCKFSKTLHDTEAREKTKSVFRTRWSVDLFNKQDLLSTYSAGFSKAELVILGLCMLVGSSDCIWGDSLRYRLWGLCSDEIKQRLDKMLENLGSGSSPSIQWRNLRKIYLLFSGVQYLKPFCFLTLLAYWFLLSYYNKTAFSAFLFSLLDSFYT